MDKKYGVRGLIIFLSVLTFISLISADIFISKQPNEVYNLGDEMSITLSSDGTAGWATLNLVCSNDTRMIYYHYMAAKDISVDINFPLTKDSLRSAVGLCYLKTIFNGLEKQSSLFQISDKIDIILTLNEKEVRPNSTITFQGTTSKLNRAQITGFAEISIKDIGINIVAPIENNAFSGEISIPDNVASKEYNVNVFAYEKDEFNEKTNFGDYTASFKVIQEPREIKLEVSKTTINPDETLEFTTTLYDQARMTIDKKPAAFKIITSQGEEVVNILSETGTANSYNLRKNAPKGIWNISTESENIQAKTQFFVTENKEASFELINNTLIITNVGNVPYDKLVEIKIGNHSEVKNFDLDLGRSVEFKLYAPDGEYDISASDGDINLTRRLMLTGSAISIGEPSRKGIFKGSILIWIILIAILGTFIFVASKKVINKKFTFRISKSSSDNTKNNTTTLSDNAGKGGVVKLVPSNKPESPKIESASDEAKHTLVTNGTKQTASFVALKIKNLEELKKSKSNAMDNINSAVREIPQNHGKIYRNDDFIVGIFAPSETKTFDNELSALRTAEDIAKRLKEHNSKFVHKIDFGIGLNSGDVAAKKENGKLLFTPLGSSMVTAKKVAEIANKKVLMSEDAHRKLTSKVKAIPHEIKSGIKTWEIGEIIARDETHNKFIEDFLKRNKEYRQLSDYRAGK